MPSGSNSLKQTCGRRHTVTVVCVHKKKYEKGREREGKRRKAGREEERKIRKKARE